MEKQKLDLSAYQIRTDLAVETKEILEQENDPNVVKKDGIQGIVEKEKEEHGIRIRTVEITKEGEALTKEKGRNILDT